MNAMNDYAGLLFLARDIAHKAHLAATTHAQHIILGEFYESIIDISDKLIEMWQGRYDRIEVAILEAPETGSILNDLQAICQIIEEDRYEVIPREDSPLQNVVDEIVGEFLRTFYKLKYLK